MATQNYECLRPTDIDSLVDGDASRLQDGPVPTVRNTGRLSVDKFTGEVHPSVPKTKWVIFTEPAETTPYSSTM